MGATKSNRLIVTRIVGHLITQGYDGLTVDDVYKVAEMYGDEPDVLEDTWGIIRLVTKVCFLRNLLLDWIKGAPDCFVFDFPDMAEKLFDHMTISWEHDFGVAINIDTITRIIIKDLRIKI